MKLKALLPFGFFAALAMFFFVGTTLNPHTLDSNLINEPMPEFELESVYLDAPPVRSDDFLGQVTLLNVFGSWCVACLYEHPYLAELQAEEDILIVGLDWRDKRENALAWLERHGDPYDVIAYDIDSDVAIDLGVTGAPETYLIDPRGVIRVKHVGVLDEAVWREKFLPVIGRIEMGA